ncbi:VOC family protein [Fulvivirga sediminis]|uniref:VOC family protein n=1 Tax=Fulvivirga sediminis TaxID=2803949 RepID=A0A937F6T8_9BACT|nr:VOC family protein [Fulvivirga sediminis]MBL3655324.1 VOC family protein [Fulvivirga sediminis]
MKQNLTHIALVVDDYDKAIEFYTQKLHFTLIEDTILSDTKRWVLVRPKGANECSLVLAKGVNEEQKSRIGNQTGGRVFLFLNTDNFKRDYQNLIDNKIKIVRGPSYEDYGTVAVFEDLYGNLWDLIEPKKEEEKFHSTGILKIKDSKNIDFAITQLKNLRSKTLLESGNISFDIKQVRDDPSKIILWECFKNEKSFNDHLNSKHLQDFVKLDLVELENGYITNNIE